LYYSENKKIKVRYLNPILFGMSEDYLPGWPRKWFELAYLKRTVVEIDIHESPNSSLR
jgi:hypothetical protein